jgi:hypothetical protein
MFGSLFFAIPSLSPSPVQTTALQIPCSDVDRAAILRAGVDGRHHWAFDSTSPKIDTVRNPRIRFPNNY